MKNYEYLASESGLPKIYLESYPLTDLQQGILFHSVESERKGMYVTQIKIMLNEVINEKMLEEAWRRTQARHEILRSFVAEIDGVHRLCISEIRDIVFKCIDLSEINAVEKNKKIEEIILNDRMLGFDLMAPPLSRFCLIKLEENQFYFIWTHHHIILSGEPAIRIIKESFESYEALINHEVKSFPELEPYGNYFQRVESQDRALASSYWKMLMQGFGTPNVLSIPVKNRKSISPLVRISEIIDVHEYKLICQYCSDNGVTVNSLVLGAWGILLSKYTSDSDVVLGTIRTLPRRVLKNSGLLINTLPVRVKINKNTKTIPYLKMIRGQQTQMIKHVYTPLKDIQAVCNMGAGSGLFDTCVDYKVLSLNEYFERLGGKWLNRKITYSFDTNYTLFLEAYGEAGGLHFRLAYDPSMFSSLYMKKMLEQYKSILLAMVSQTNECLVNLEYLSSTDKQQLLYDWSQGAVSKHNYKNLSVLFDEQVAKTPDNIAVEHCGLETSYSELNQLVARFASNLSAKKSLNRVAVVLNRGQEMIVAILATLKCGAAYIPIDPDYPDNRIQYIVEDSKAEIVITQKSLIERSDYLCSIGDRIFDIKNQIYPEVHFDSVENSTDVNRLACIIYTSGSTGKPKGVMVTHKNLTNTLFDMQTRLGINSRDRWLAITTIAFDIAGAEIYLPLISGARVVLSEKESKDPSLLIDLLVKSKASILQATPSLWRLLIQNEWPDDFKITAICTGEALDYELAKALRSTVGPFWNLYGPTETSIWALAKKIDDLDDPMAIGRPISNAKAYVLDRYQKLVPIGAKGELYLGGAGVTKGYTNKEDLTRKSFISKRFSESENDELLYKTGDMVRCLPEGDIEYIGRSDDQVKVRGYRIEPKEISDLLLAHKSVKEAVIVPHNNNTGHIQLIAYLVLHKGETVDNKELRKFIQKELPDYMTPSAFVVLKAMPLTANKKINKRLLEEKKNKPLERDEIYISSKNPIEKLLVKIWSECLELEEHTIDLDDNFFELGGDSIMSMQVVNKAKSNDIHFTVQQLFSNPTVRMLSSVCSTKLETEEKLEHVADEIVSGVVPITPAQYWYFSKNPTNPSHFHQVAKVTLDQSLNIEKIKEAFQYLTEYHDMLRARFSFNPRQSSWNQYILERVPTEERYVFEVHEVDQSVDLNSVNVELSINITNGPLLHVVHLKNEKIPNGVLHFYGHHLIFDGLSWRIFLQDLECVYRQLCSGEMPSLPKKTMSYKEWSQKLTDYAQSRLLKDEVSYWLKQCPDSDSLMLSGEQLKIDHRASFQRWLKEKYPIRNEIMTLKFTQEETDFLLRSCNELINVEALLLTALNLLFSHIDSFNSLSVTLEGHGREQVVAANDVTRSLGWYTSFKPLKICLSNISDLFASLLEVTDQINRMPNKGIGFGILKYLNLDNDVIEKINNLNEPLVCFNYLGKFTKLDSHQEAVTFDLNSIDLDKPEYHPSDHVIEIDAVIQSGMLSFRWSYCPEFHEQSTIRSLIERFNDLIGSLVKVSQKNMSKLIRPSKFPLAKLNLSESYNILSKLKTDLSVSNTAFDIEDIYPLSNSQKGLLIQSRLNYGSEDYFMQVSMLLRGPLDIEVFQRSWQNIVDKNSILRTGFLMLSSGNAYQYVLKACSLTWRYFDFSPLDEMQQQETLESHLLIDRQTPFDLSAAPLLRCMLVKLSDNTFRFILSYHHIILDGWSLANLIQMAQSNYHHFQNDIYLKKKISGAFSGVTEGGISEGECMNFPSVAVVNETIRPYKDYIAWLMTQDTNEATTYWKKLLSNIDKDSRLSIESANSTSTPAAQQGSYTFCLDETLSQELNSLAKDQHVTLNTVMQSAWSVLLNKYIRSDDVIYGTTASGRPIDLDKSDSMLGLFINTFPVRVKVNSEWRIVDLFSEVQKQLITSQSHGHVGLSNIINWTSSSGKEIFDTLFVFENYPVTSIPKEASIQLSDMDVSEKTHYKMTVMVVPGEQTQIIIRFNNVFFKKTDIVQLSELYRTLLSSFSDNPYAKIIDASYIPKKEYARLTNSNVSKKELPKSSIISVIEQHAVSKTLSHFPALSFENTRFSYRGLNEKVNQIARYVRESVNKGEYIGILLPRVSEYVLSVLAVLKISCAFVPMDPNQPPARIASMIADGGINTIISIQDHANTFNSLKEFEPVNWLLLDQDQQKIDSQQKENLGINIDMSMPAYAIFTSGSTGKPKGVSVSHEALSNLLFGMKTYFNLDQNDRFLALSPFIFDISIIDVFLPLLCSSQMILAGEDTAFNPTLIQSLIKKHQVSFMQATPVTWRLLIKSGWKPNKKIRVVSTGESLSKSLANQLLKNKVQVWNMYGPTEATVWSTAYRLKQTLNESEVPIGMPTPNVVAYVLDPHLKPVAVGMVGELYVSGSGLAMGYLNSPDLTARYFIPNPFSKNASTRMYKTGDLVKWSHDGNLEYLGRADNQIKIRGFRIEPGDIENKLVTHPLIEESVVLIKDAAENDKRLVAFLVTTNSSSVGQLNSDCLRDFLNTSLPYYMIPNEFICIDKIPLTSSHKLDKKALWDVSGERLQTAVSVVEEASKDELDIINLFAQALNIDPKTITREDSLFSLGGDSLSGIHLLDLIEKKFSIKLPIRYLFAHPKPADLAIKVDQIRAHSLLPDGDKTNTKIGSNTSTSLLTLQARGEKTPLFLIHPIGGTVFWYMSLVQHLPQDRPIYAIQDPGIEAKDYLFASFKELSSHYLELIREVQPTGPYYVGGASYGGNVAVEIAYQLVQAGERCSIFSMDSWAQYSGVINNDLDWFQNNLLRQNKTLRQLLKGDEQLPDLLLDLNWQRQQLLSNHIINQADYELYLFKSKELTTVFSSIQAPYNYWDHFTTRTVRRFMVPGNHETILSKPNVGVLAEILQQVMEHLDTSKLRH